MTKTWKFYLGAAALVVAGAAGAQADAPTEAAAEKAPETEVQALTTAANLAAYGRQARDPYAMIAAARIELGVSPAAADYKPASTQQIAAGAAAPAAGAKKTDHHDGDHKSHAAALLDEAQAFARGDKTVLAAIDSTRKQGSRGATCGCKSGRYRLDAQSIQSFDIAFRGGELAEVLIQGDGDADLDVYVYDVNGRLVTRDTDRSAVAYARWKPYDTQQYTIRVANVGDVWSVYRLTTN